MAAGAVSNGVMGKVVVIGGSAGGIQSLCKVLERLPPEVSATLFGVIHMREGSNHLPRVLQPCDSIKVGSARTGGIDCARRLYLPLPNHHLIVRNGCAARGQQDIEKLHEIISRL